MPAFNPEFVALMRTVLDDVMLLVPSHASNSTTKTLLAEAILKAAAQGQSSYNDLLATATDHMQTIISTLS